VADAVESPKRGKSLKAFSGLPSGRVCMVSLPETVFAELVPLIDDLAELKVTLHILWRLAQQQRSLRYMRYEALLEDKVLLSALGENPRGTLDSALERAVRRGTVLRAVVGSGGSNDVLFLANTAKGRAAAEAIGRGEWPEGLEVAEQANIFALYHANVGVLTPLLADELREAETMYPAEWIEDAFRIAVSLNKRNWRYIRAILERWSSEGRGDEADQRDNEADRRRYIEGKYGDYIQH